MQFDLNTRVRGPSRHYLTVVVAMLATAIAGCQTIASLPTPLTAPTTASVESAEQATLAGDYVVAAREYENLAAAADKPKKQDYQLRAAEAVIKAGEASQARRILGNVVVAGLDPGLTARKRILEARLALLDGAHEKAIRRLDEAVRLPALNPQLRAEIYQARAQVEIALNNPVAAARNFINREQYITGIEAITDNQLQLWAVLEKLPVTRLRTELDLAGDQTLTGWIELALASSDTPAPKRRLAIDHWRDTHPDHPARAAIIELLTQKAPGIVGRIERIALLLPLTSNHGAAARAVHDGFQASAAVLPAAERPRILVYDIGDDPAQAAVAYDRAVNEDRAQVVVGPLGRDAADAILRSGRLSVPTLLLSHLEQRPATSVPIFQFGLPPEQEARAVAERAYFDGHRQAAILYPASPWGERVQLAFAEHWQRLGGLVISKQDYDEGIADFSEQIKRLLNVSESEKRKAFLDALAGHKLEFEPRRRQDIDFFFLAADAKRGRLLKPQLNFHGARNVPVYATSHIYGGRPDPLSDLDLDGVMFGDMPWLLAAEGPVAQLRQALSAGAPTANGDIDRLYALGVDSFSVLAHLNRLGADESTRFAGVTSGLSLDPDGRLRRQLVWAKFRNGTPRLLDAR